MTQEDKKLLLKDLSARLLYGVKCDYEGSVLEIDRIDVTNEEVYGNLIAWYDAWSVEKCRPYLRPMSSMTEEERDEFRKVGGVMSYSPQHDTWAISAFAPEAYDWLNSHHFDYRGLIPMGLAIEAPEGMYQVN